MLESDFIKAEDEGSNRLMIVLHGLGDSMAGYRWLPAIMKCSWLNYLLVNAPTPYYGGYSWYDFMDNPGPGIEISRKALFAVLDKQRQAGFASEQTVVFGFSQGSLMAIEAGTRYPHRFAGVIGISGYAWEPERLVKELSPVAREQKFLLTHGTQDALIPIDMVRAQIEVLKSAGLKIEWHEFIKEHSIAGEEEISLIQRFLRDCFSERE